jgi:TatD DNase family protein
VSLELFDTHCHLNLPEHFPDPDADIERAKAAGVSRLAVVGIDLESCDRAIALAERHEGVYAIVGWHPNSAAEFSEAALNQISDMLAHPKVVALGEIGLDYHWDFATPDQQRACLADQLALAEESGMPVVFHCRKAYDDLLDILEARPPRPYLFHCFSGDAGHAYRVRKLDGWIGVDGPLTYKKSNDLRSVVADWPRNRLVLETDSPYLSPEPHRGKPNHPSYLTLVNQRLAACWNVEPEVSGIQTTSNACGIFGIAR